MFWKRLLSGFVILTMLSSNKIVSGYRNEEATRRRFDLSVILGNMEPDYHPPSSKYLLEQDDFFKRSSARNKQIFNTKTSLPSSKYKTTKHIKEIFIGRCYEYRHQKQISTENTWNCEKLWLLFSKVFMYKPPCSVQSKDYETFLNVIDEDVPKDKVLLWSGSREVAHKYSDFSFTRRFTTLEDTMAGYLVNELKWCGKVEPPGINFEECPWECSIQPQYWSAANKKLAKKIRGIVHILLNGTRQHLIDRNVYPAYMKDRYYLGPDIIPELDKQRVTRVIIIVAHTLLVKPLESCGEKTVQVLFEEIKKKGIPVECYNNTDKERLMHCISDRHYLVHPTIGPCGFMATVLDLTVLDLTGQKHEAQFDVNWHIQCRPVETEKANRNQTICAIVKMNLKKYKYSIAVAKDSYFHSVIL